MANRIEDYAMIGDCKTAALVGINGSIDWMCLPRFDSDACFSSILNDEQNSSWCIAPLTPKRVSRSYLDGGLILQTRFEVEGGEAEIIDFMPMKQETSHVIRLVRGLQGRVHLRCTLLVRFNYGLTIPWLNRQDDQTLMIVAGPDALVLRTPILLDASHGIARADFQVAAGETIPFVLSHGLSHFAIPAPLDPEKEFLSTKAFWDDWSARCRSAGRWTPSVKRSMATLKGLSHLDTGGIVAAITTSLPEAIGGERNWDYRYCWLRDASLTLLAFLNGGYDKEASSWGNWLLRAIAGSPSQIQIMYGIAGERRLQEWVVPQLAGYENSSPVRVGNNAASQSQTDIYGELSEVLSIGSQAGLERQPRGTEIRRDLLEHLESTWEQADQGIWEMRGSAQHFTYSKVAAWVAFDRAANDTISVETAKRESYRSLANRIHADICKNAVHPELHCFTQAYSSDQMDASLLLMAMVGFLPPEDERILNTVAEIEKQLLCDGRVKRYASETSGDGLSGGEGMFLACSFWLVDNYVLQGRLQEAEDMFDKLVQLGNDVGLFAEEYDVKTKCQLGNFPQAFSHVGLINSAYALARAKENLK